MVSSRNSDAAHTVGDYQDAGHLAPVADDNPIRRIEISSGYNLRHSLGARYEV